MIESVTPVGAHGHAPLRDAVFHPTKNRYIQGNQNLSETARNLIEDEGNQKLLSVASLWEISIKVSIGKLDVGMTIAELVSREVYGNGFEVLAIQANHLVKQPTAKSAWDSAL